jgi:hypothetical protein
MVTLVTALGLLTVAHVITTLIMTKVLHLRDYYNWHLYVSWTCRLVVFVCWCVSLVLKFDSLARMLCYHTSVVCNAIPLWVHVPSWYGN